MRATPYRSAALVPPQSFEWSAAALIARWAIALRLMAAIVPWLGMAFPRIGPSAVGLELGACAAIGLASWRLYRAATAPATRWTAAGSTALAVACLLLWQPLAGTFSLPIGPQLGEDIQSQLDLATLWRAGTWLSPLILWVIIRVERGSASAPALNAAPVLESATLRAQSAALRSVSAAIAGIVLSMVGSITTAIFFEMRGAHWNTSAFIRGTGIILTGLFAARTLRALGRLQRWSPSVTPLSGALALWACAVVAWLFVIREWLYVLVAIDGRTHIADAFAVQGLIALTTLAAIATVLWGALALAARASVLGHRALWVAASLGLATTSALMIRVHVTIPSFVMRTTEEHRIVALTLASAAASIFGGSLFARRIAAALDEKSTELEEKSG